MTLYLLFGLSLIVTLALGIVVLEGFIEDDGALADFFDLWTWTHELPILLWPLLFITISKIAIDLTLNQNLMVALERERASSEIKFLKSQLSPHVLFNNLNNIYSFALHQSKKTPKLILKLADTVRYMLYEAQQDVVPLEKELIHLDDYVELQQIQLEKRGELIYEKKGNVKNKMIAPMMLISFIENCFKHASTDASEKMKIIIQIEVQENTLNLFTENTFKAGSKDDDAHKLQEGGIGLSNVRRRLELLYPNAHSLIVKELEKLYIVNLSIELNEASR